MKTRSEEKSTVRAEEADGIMDEGIRGGLWSGRAGVGWERCGGCGEEWGKGDEPICKIFKRPQHRHYAVPLSRPSCLSRRPAVPPVPPVPWVHGAQGDNVPLHQNHLFEHLYIEKLIPKLVHIPNNTSRIHFRYQKPHIVS